MADFAHQNALWSKGPPVRDLKGLTYPTHSAKMGEVNEGISMLVNELLGGEILTCDTNTLVVDAARLMVGHDAGSLAVMTEGELVGIVTERDLIKFVADPGLGTDARVGQVMTPNPDALEGDVEVSYAADWMLAAGYRHLPVVEGDKTVGIISIKDVLWGLTQGRDNR